jgi:hypothetical protein
MSPWVHFNKPGQICSFKLALVTNLPPACPYPDCAGLQLKWIEEKVAVEMARTRSMPPPPAPPPLAPPPLAPPPPAPPPLRYKPFMIIFERAWAETDLKLQGLCDRIEKKKSGKLVRDEVKKGVFELKPPQHDNELDSAIRFVAQSHYLKQESKRIADTVVPSELKSADDKRNVPTIVNAIAKQCPYLEPWPLSTDDWNEEIDRKPDRNKALRAFLCEGMDILEKISREEKGSAEEVAKHLATHAHMMDAKGYGRWVHHFKFPEKKNVAVQKTVTISLDLKAQQGTFNVMQTRWLVYPIYQKERQPNTEDGEAQELIINQEYYFFPPRDIPMTGFIGKIIGKNDAKKELTIEVTE